MNITKYHWVQQYCFRDTFRVRYLAMFAFEAFWTSVMIVFVFERWKIVYPSLIMTAEKQENLATGVDRLDFRMNPHFTVNKWHLDLLWQNFCQHVKVFSFHMKEVSLNCCLDLFIILVFLKKSPTCTQNNWIQHRAK